MSPEWVGAVAAAMAALCGIPGTILALLELKRKRAAPSMTARRTHKALLGPAISALVALRPRLRWMLSASVSFAAAAIIVTILPWHESEPPIPPTTNSHTCTTVSRSVSIVVGARANSPMPKIPDDLLETMSTGAESGTKVTLVRVDGYPEIVWQQQFVPAAQAEPVVRRDVNGFMSTVVAAVESVRATTPESDLLGAISIASRSTGPGGLVIVLDSGLQTIEPLDFRVDGLLEAEPDDVSRYLSQRDLLPDLNGKTVVFVGIGDVALPQPQLYERQRRNLLSIWRSLVDEAGAVCVADITDPAWGEPASGVPAVGIVQVSSEMSVGCGTTVLEAGEIGFVPDQATFADPDEARELLESVAEFIIGRNANVELIGTAESGGTAVALSRARAEAVASILIELGVPRNVISSTGVGSNWPGYIQDRDPDGRLLPAVAARNRSVIIETDCP